MRRFTLNLWPSNGAKKLVEEDQESAVIDGVDGNGKKTFGIKHYLHQFYLSPTVEEVETSGTWYVPFTKMRGEKCYEDLFAVRILWRKIIPRKLAKFHLALVGTFSHHHHHSAPACTFAAF